MQPTKPQASSPPKKTVEATTASESTVTKTVVPKAKESEPVKSPTEPEQTPVKDKPANEATVEKVAPTALSHGMAVIDEANWPQVLAELKTQYNTLYSIIRNAHTAFNDGKVELTFNFDFHRKRVNEAKNRKIVSKVIKNVCGQDVELVCLFDKNSKPSAVAVTAPATAAPVVEAVSNIFGGGELLSS